MRQKESGLNALNMLHEGKERKEELTPKDELNPTHH